VRKERLHEEAVQKAAQETRSHRKPEARSGKAGCRTPRSGAFGGTRKPKKTATNKPKNAKKRHTRRPKRPKPTPVTGGENVGTIHVPVASHPALGMPALRRCNGGITSRSATAQATKNRSPSTLSTAPQAKRNSAKALTTKSSSTLRAKNGRFTSRRTHSQRVGWPPLGRRAYLSRRALAVRWSGPTLGCLAERRALSAVAGSAEKLEACARCSRGETSPLKLADARKSWKAGASSAPARATAPRPERQRRAWPSRRPLSVEGHSRVAALSCQRRLSAWRGEVQRGPTTGVLACSGLVFVPGPCLPARLWVRALWYIFVDDRHRGPDRMEGLLSKRAPLTSGGG